jgi:hypothetical protein
MIQKEIIYFGQKAIIACDEKCNKAWGINNRSRIQLDENDEDNYVWLTDGELGEAPDDPGIYEGFEMCGKPKSKEDRLNKWCCRECERCFKSSPGPIMLNNFDERIYNIPRRFII